MLCVKYYAMLIIINIRRILEAPIRIIYLDGYYTVILACRKIYSAGIALALAAKHTFRISRLRCVFWQPLSLWGPFPGFERFIVISRSPYSVFVIHFISFSTR